MTLNCIIIDDEPLAASLLVSYAQKTPFIHLIGAYNSAVEAIKEVRSNQIDLIFLDIQMPDLSGLEFSKILPPETKIVFTTAFKQYAIEGYKVNALDYLTKPISYESFIAASNKALDWFHHIKKIKQDDQDRFIYVKSEYKLIQIHLKDILFIEGLKDYVKFYLENEQPPIMSLMNMKTIEDNLPHPEFLRCHRSYIVHMPKVKLIDRFRFVFGDKFIPISERYKDNIQKYLESHTMV